MFRSIALAYRAMIVFALLVCISSPEFCAAQFRERSGGRGGNGGGNGAGNGGGNGARPSMGKLVAMVPGRR